MREWVGQGEGSFGCDGSSLLQEGFLSLHEQRLLFIAVCELLIAVASLLSVHRLYAWASVVATLRLGFSAVCGIFPGQESNQCPLHCKMNS